MFKELINTFPKLTEIDILVTENCNLNCEYCYVKKKVDSYMSKSTFFKLFRQYKRAFI